MMRRQGSGRLKGRAGFTVAELLVYLIVSVIVIGAVYQLLIGQNRLFSKQKELADVRGTLRLSAEILAGDLRQISASGGDLIAISRDSVVLRSIQGAGYVCVMNSDKTRMGMLAKTGEFGTTADDSVMMLAAGGSSASDDTWAFTSVTATYGSMGGGLSACAWGGWPTEEVIAVDTVDGTVLADVKTGAPIRSFRVTTYGLFQEDERWWLGRRVGAAGSYEAMAGPMRPPSDSGLAFYFYDQTGAVTSDPAQVRLVEILLRGESLGAVRRKGAAPTVQVDSVRTRAWIRG